MRVAVLVPRRDDGGRRDELWRWNRDRWARLHPDWTVHEGHHESGPFNRSAALNRAAEQSDWDVAVVADSDSFVGVDNIRAAVNLTVETGEVTFAYDRFCYLNRSMSDRIMAGFVGDWFPGVEWALPGTCSSMVTFTRHLWDQLGGGMDEGFVGWGGEDVALSLALQTFGGGMRRIPGEVWHLWHPPAPHTHDDVWPDRMNLYRDASYDRDKMRRLMAGLRGSVSV